MPHWAATAFLFVAPAFSSIDKKKKAQDIASWSIARVLLWGGGRALGLEELLVELLSHRERRWPSRGSYVCRTCVFLKKCSCFISSIFFRLPYPCAGFFENTHIQGRGFGARRVIPFIELFRCSKSCCPQTDVTFHYTRSCSSQTCRRAAARLSTAMETLFLHLTHLSRIRSPNLGLTTRLLLQAHFLNWHAGQATLDFSPFGALKSHFWFSLNRTTCDSTQVKLVQDLCPIASTMISTTSHSD